MSEIIIFIGKIEAEGGRKFTIGEFVSATQAFDGGPYTFEYIPRGFFNKLFRRVRMAKNIPPTAYAKPIPDGDDLWHWVFRGDNGDSSGSDILRDRIDENVDTANKALEESRRISAMEKIARMKAQQGVAKHVADVTSLDEQLRKKREEGWEEKYMRP